jgi:ABC-2 type transport system permease protein
LSKRLKQYGNEASARSAVDREEISDFFIILPNYIQDGKVTYIRPDFNPLSGMDQSTIVRDLVNFNLVGNDTQLAERLQSTLGVEVAATSERPVRDSDNMLTFFLPYGVMLLFYILIISSSTLLLNSITREKENRVIEILMTSITPMQMLSGKIIALGVVGLSQTLIWSGIGLLLMRVSGTSFNLPIAFQLPTSILVWGGLFFVLGYGVYATIMAGVGALVPNMKEASQATTLAITPLMIPLFLLSVLVEDPNGALSIGLSLFPLTAPTAMMTRLAIGPVPLLELAIAAVLMIALIYLEMRLVSGLFQAKYLLSGQAFSLKVLFRALTGRL